MELEVHCALGDDFEGALRRGMLDLAVYDVPEISAFQERLRTENLVWMASRYHDAARRAPLPVAVFDRACWWRDVALADLSTARCSYRTVFTSESVVGVRAAVVAGMAVALLAESAQGDDLITLPELAPARPSHLVLHLARQAGDSGMDALCKAIRAALGNSANRGVH